jgi:thioredoxin-like negative regulator of GroEL
MAPLIDKVSQEFDNLELVKVDADLPENEDILRQYDIRSIPTLVLLNSDGEIVSAIVGSHTEQEIRHWIYDEMHKDDKLEEIREEADTSR